MPYIYCLLTGKLVKREREFHEKYGDIIRLAPDEISFANEEAWNEIYSFRPGHKRAVRDKAYYVGWFPLLSITGITVLTPIEHQTTKPIILLRRVIPNFTGVFVA